MTRRKLLTTALIGLPLLFSSAVWLIGGLLSAPFNQRVGELPPDLQVGRAVEFASESGATVRGWIVPGQKGAGAVVLMHGVRANRLSMLGRARFLHRAGYTVLLFDFQAHGETPGERITFGYRESHDARAAVAFLRANAPGERVGIIGVSMGGAAMLLATPLIAADAVVLEMVYPTIKEAIANRLTMRLGSWSSALTPLLSAQLRLGVDAEELRPINKVWMLPRLNSSSWARTISTRRSPNLNNFSERRARRKSSGPSAVRVTSICTRSPGRNMSSTSYSFSPHISGKNKAKAKTIFHPSSFILHPCFYSGHVSCDATREWTLNS
ncbi:MAG: alpha/beta fold hydrolase [Acidobacteriota bacterium]|nr:alpha/beta fold hydrolase [Acidobacteriota bacterium]